MKYNKDLYSKDKIQKMILDNSLLKEYSESVGSRNMSIGCIGLLIALVAVVVPAGFLIYFVFSLSKHDIENQEYGFLIGSILVIILVAIVAIIFVGSMTGFFFNKVLGKHPTFREFTEPVLLGYELALKRVEVESKMQDYEFLFENKEFFHGLHIIKDLLKVRHMELENQLAMIPIEKRNRENEIYQAILERKLENSKQMDWLSSQLENLQR